MSDIAPECETKLTLKEIEDAKLPPVDFIPDMKNVFDNAESVQKNNNNFSLCCTKQNITELLSKTIPAVELSLAVLAETVNLKTSMNDFFTAETS